MTALQELIDRVKAATGPDRELDHAIGVFFELSGADKHDGPHLRRIWRGPRLAASLDAALAFVERVLPGAEYNISTLYGHAMAELPINADNYLAPQVLRMDGNMPLAIIECALLAKLQEQADG
jgi:hypothetical protein